MLTVEDEWLIAARDRPLLTMVVLGTGDLDRSAADLTAAAAERQKDAMVSQGMEDDDGKA
jgi:hypothetical protein